ncbi:hypothetical protein Y1Q_0007105 [Alligator mississippiensis]|uniref:Uncharacterized protein n=1 Tax=Alligator mississippiensis TaxID=8496 RepID=A0A151N5K1_ALLMI|nr:hypothetical protein Y1Q_0007105 [Alligator mississippiensis]
MAAAERSGAEPNCCRSSARRAGRNGCAHARPGCVSGQNGDLSCKPGHLNGAPEAFSNGFEVIPPRESSSLAVEILRGVQCKPLHPRQKNSPSINPTRKVDLQA